MSKLTIIADIQARPDQVDLVRAELEKLIPITRAEPGCLQYDLHQDDEDPAHFVFLENWASREQYEAHLQAPHLDAWRSASQGSLSVFTLHEMTQIG